MGYENSGRGGFGSGNKRGGGSRRGGSDRRGGSSRFGNNDRGGNSGGFGNNRFGGGNRSYNDRPKEMHKAICADCKVECEVPFKPSGERPVYCRDCFAKHKPARF